MALSRQQIDALVKAVSLTNEVEMTCDECLKELAEFAERSLSGKSISEGMKAIEHHLTICAECHEEYKALLAALKDAERNEP